MPQVIVAGAEPVEIAHETQDGTPFSITHMGGGEVHLDHNKRDVVSNPTRVMVNGDEGELRAVRSGVWAYAPEDDAEIRVGTNDGFILNLFGTVTAERPADKAARKGNKRSNDTDTSLAADGTDTVDLIPQSETADGPVEVERVTTASWDDHTKNARVIAEEYDETDTRIGRWYLEPGQNLHFDGLRLGTDHYMRLFVTNFDTDPTVVGASAIWREVV